MIELSKKYATRAHTCAHETILGDSQSLGHFGIKLCVTICKSSD